jgi:hypothetical protein
MRLLSRCWPAVPLLAVALVGCGRDGGTGPGTTDKPRPSRPGEPQVVLKVPGMT